MLRHVRQGRGGEGRRRKRRGVRVNWGGMGLVDAAGGA